MNNEVNYRIPNSANKNVSYPISIARAFKIYTMRYVYGCKILVPFRCLYTDAFLNTGTFLFAELYGIFIIQSHFKVTVNPFRVIRS